MILIWRVRKLSSRSVKSPGVCGLSASERTKLIINRRCSPRGGDDLQQFKMEVDAIGAHLRGFFLIKFALKSIRWEPMRWILIL
jgi:hypothetical protein